jgi:hypothetical protein
VGRQASAVSGPGCRMEQGGGDDEGHDEEDRRRDLRRADTALSVLATLSPSPLEESNAQRARGPLKLYIASLAIDYETPISIPLIRCS